MEKESVELVTVKVTPSTRVGFASEKSAKSFENALKRGTILSGARKGGAGKKAGKPAEKK